MMIKKYIFYFCLVAISFTQIIDDIDRNAFKSLILPGWGEMSISHNNRAKNFLILEACTWLSFLGSHYSNNWYIDNYMSFGSHHANIDLDAISDNELSLLIVHLSQYNSLDEYNETMERQRRYNDTYPNNSKYNWHWDSSNNRKVFNDLRIKSAYAYKINNFTIAALIINRLVSFFDVIYLNGKSYDIQSTVMSSSNNQLLFNCSISF